MDVRLGLGWNKQLKIKSKMRARGNEREKVAGVRRK